MSERIPRITEAMGYDCEVSVPNGPAMHGYVLARWADRRQPIFEKWYAEKIRAAKETAWRQGVLAAWPDTVIEDFDWPDNPYAEESE